MKRSVFFVAMILIACIGGVLGSIITIQYLGVSNPNYNSIQDRQQLVLTGRPTDTVYRIPDDLNFLSTAKQRPRSQQ